MSSSLICVNNGHVEKVRNASFGGRVRIGIARMRDGRTQWVSLSAASGKTSDSRPHPAPETIVSLRWSAIQLVPDARPRHCRGH